MSSLNFKMHKDRNLKILFQENQTKLEKDSEKAYRELSIISRNKIKTNQKLTKSKRRKKVISTLLNQAVRS